MYGHMERHCVNYEPGRPSVPCAQPYVMEELDWAIDHGTRRLARDPAH